MLLQNEPAGRPVRLLELVNRLKLDDLELLRARWGSYLHLVADSAVQKRAPNWRRGRDQPLFGVGLFAADQLVLDLDVLFHVQHHDPRPKAGAIGWDVAQIKHPQVAKPLFELTDTRADE